MPYTEGRGAMGALHEKGPFAEAQLFAWVEQRICYCRGRITRFQKPGSIIALLLTRPGRWQQRDPDHVCENMKS